MIASSDSFFALVHARHSCGAKHLTLPVPTEEELAQLLGAALRSPCHEKTRPYRWVKIDSREVLADAFEEALPPGSDEKTIDRARSKALKGPMLLALIETRTHEADDLTRRERLITMGASLQTLLLGLTALGYAAKTVSGRVLPDTKGLYDAETEALHAFLLVGTPDTPIEEEAATPSPFPTW